MSGKVKYNKYFNGNEIHAPFLKPGLEKACHGRQLLGNPHRAGDLAEIGLAKRPTIVEGKGRQAGSTGKVFVLARLLRAVELQSRYRALPWKAAAKHCGQVLYFVNPADIIPDFVPLRACWMIQYPGLNANAVQDELENFEWKA